MAELIQMDDSMKLKYKKCKYRVKKWESEFKKQSGVNPSKADIKSAPSKIKEAYRMYWMLKTKALENTLLDIDLDETTQDCFNLDSSLADRSYNNSDDVLQSCDNSFMAGILDESITINDSVKSVNNFDTKISEEVDKRNEKDLVQESALECIDKPANEKSEKSSKDESELDNFVNSKSVWGDHVSKKSEKKTVEKKQKTVKYPFMEKIWKGFTCKPLKNPNNRKRKKVTAQDLVGKCFSDNEEESESCKEEIDEKAENITSNQKDKGQEKSDLVKNSVKTSLLHQFYEEEHANVDKNEPFLRNVNEIERSDTDLEASRQNKPLEKQELISGSPSAFNIFDEKVKVIIKSTPPSARSLNVSCTGLALAKPKSSIVRSLDKGWVERANNYNKLSNENSSITDSGFESFESLNSSSVKSSNSVSTSVTETKSNDVNLQDDDTLSDDNFVCNSDSETENKSRLSSLSFKRKRETEVVAGEDLPVVLKRYKQENLVQNQEITQAAATVFKPIENSRDVNSEEKSTIKNKPSDIERKEGILRKKVESGKANKNFVRINIQKKVYVRGKKTMTFSKYKKKQWKKRKDQLQSEGSVNSGSYRCYKCNEVGHYARSCSKGLDQLIPKEELDEAEEESQYITLEEADRIAKEANEQFASKKSTNKPKETTLKEDKLNENDNEQLVNESDSQSILESEINIGELDILQGKPSCPPLFDLNEDGTLIDTPLICNQALLQFGYTEFRPGQEKAIMRILSGLSTLVTLSTGSGKSLCYQLPALLFRNLSKSSSITLVVSPLVSLMEDQVTNMLNAPIKMGCLHTNQTPKQREAVIEELKSGNLAVLMVSPEAIVASESQSGLLKSVFQNLPPISFACIDEVHCLSQWSHNFRPSYLLLCKVLRERFGVKTFLGLTATATQSTISNIVELLAVPDGMNGVVTQTPIPSNLILTVSRDENREQALVDLLQTDKFKYPASVIIYCTRREECERVAKYIRTKLQEEELRNYAKKRGRISCVAEAYHAGLVPAKRKKVQHTFMSGELRIVVATVAFGMGINKQNVRGIIHYNMPSNFESYVQEVGRAGRDGLPAFCHLFLDSRGNDLNELRRHIFANSMDRHTLRKLLQHVFVPCDCKDTCTNHEVAFSIADTVEHLDLKEEIISTLLCYLELHPRKWVQLFSHTYTICTVRSYKGPKFLSSMARKCPPLALALAQEQNKGKLNKDNITTLKFPIVELASKMKWDSGKVKYHMKELEWTTSSKGAKCRSGLLVEFSELGFRVQAPGNLSNEELDSALDTLHQHVKSQETTALYQLKILFDTLTEISCKDVDQCSEVDMLPRSNKLKSQIREYFQNSIDPKNLSPVLPEKKLKNEDQIIADIRKLVSSYKDISFTGRSVARVFHGIGTPKFPAVIMGRSPLWRAYLHEDFSLLCNLATKELIRMK